ncbi:hypothetical protein PIB30_043338 [Stylosanthes scabra]|uniref:Uncharacterized protein n=1 Tax=Stylosanthes scabra TaxID=79078 RepID=A0ABU6UES3_9FABA|nr:hypothetical protein [Stylosanthes scabra]
MAETRRRRKHRDGVDGLRKRTTEILSASGTSNARAKGGFFLRHRNRRQRSGVGEEATMGDFSMKGNFKFPPKHYWRILKSADNMKRSSVFAEKFLTKSAARSPLSMPTKNRCDRVQGMPDTTRNTRITVGISVGLFPPIISVGFTVGSCVLTIGSENQQKIRRKRVKTERCVSLSDGEASVRCIRRTVPTLCTAIERKKTPLLPSRRPPSSPPSVAATTVAAACCRAVTGEATVPPSLPAICLTGLCVMAAPVSSHRLWMYDRFYTDRGEQSLSS